MQKVGQSSSFYQELKKIKEELEPEGKYPGAKMGVGPLIALV